MFRLPFLGRTVLPAAVLALALAGCGNQPSSEKEAAAPAPTRIGTCSADDPAVTSAPVVGAADLTGRGPVDLKVTASDSACPDVLFAVDGDATYQTQLPGAVDPKARAISVRGHRGQLVVLVQPHPRGGFQTHVYAASDGVLAELTDDQGNPLAPFVATDTSTRIAVLDCGPDGSLVKTESKPTEPRGVIPGWDVFATTYAVSGGKAVPGATVRLEHSTPARGFDAKHPEFRNGSSFTHCS